MHIRAGGRFGVTQHESIRVINEVEKALNGKDLARFVDLHAESVVLYSPDSPEPRKGRAAIREWYGGFLNAFPDLEGKRERAFAQGEWVCVEYMVSGTHKGPLPGPEGEIPPTNRQVRVTNCSVYRVQGGKITEVHEYFDQLAFMAQLGLMK